MNTDVIGGTIVTTAFSLIYVLTQILLIKQKSASSHQAAEDRSAEDHNKALLTITETLGKVVSENTVAINKLMRSQDEAVLALQRIATVQESGHTTTHRKLEELSPLRDWVEKERAKCEERVKTIEAERDKALRDQKSLADAAQTHEKIVAAVSEERDKYKSDLEAALKAKRVLEATIERQNAELAALRNPQPKPGESEESKTNAESAPRP